MSTPNSPNHVGPEMACKTFDRGRLLVKLGVDDVGDMSQVAAPSDVVSVTPVIDAVAYAAGDAVGPKQTLTAAARISGGKALLQSLVIQDKSNNKAVLTVLLFDSDPTNGTYTNNAAVVLGTDIAKVVGRIDVAAGDYVTVDSKAVAILSNLGLLMKASGTANLFAAVVLVSGTPTFAVGDLTFKYGFLQG